MDETRVCYDVQISGRVQGVGFRYATQREARRLGLDGWVRNCADGSVEAQICGSIDSIQHMLEWLRTGPATAHVTQLSFAIQATCQHSGFVIMGDKTD